MSVFRDEVRHVARLARLALDEDEAESLAGELSGILEHVEALRGAPVAEADEEGPEPLELAPRVRPDGEGPDALVRPPSELAPDWREGFFVLPRLTALDQDVGEGP